VDLVVVLFAFTAFAAGLVAVWYGDTASEGAPPAGATCVRTRSGPNRKAMQWALVAAAASLIAAILGAMPR
jgi:hypothetical protein